jgi:hypothetical protein
MADNDQQARFSRVGGYVLAAICWSTILLHGYQVDKQGKELNIPLVAIALYFAGLGCGLPVQELDLKRFLGGK